MLSDFSSTANAIAATTRKSEKERILADYLRSLDDPTLERAAVFFSGSPFSRRALSTLDDVRRIYEGQLRREAQEGD